MDSYGLQLVPTHLPFARLQLHLLHLECLEVEVHNNTRSSTWSLQASLEDESLLSLETRDMI